MKTKKEIYHSYLQSEEWKLLRQLAIIRNKNLHNGLLTCIDCGLTHKKIYDVHHEHYPSSGNYWNDDRSNFHVVLCRDCHEKRHDINNDDMMIKIDKRPSKTFLSTHAAFYLYNPYFLDNYINIIIDECIDFDEYADLFALIIENSKNNDSTKDFMYKLKASSIDDHIIKEFAINTISFNGIYDEIIELEKECGEKIINHDTKSKALHEMMINFKKVELEDKQKEVYDRMLDMNNSIITSIKKYKIKLKGLA